MIASLMLVVNELIRSLDHVIQCDIPSVCNACQPARRLHDELLGGDQTFQRDPRAADQAGTLGVVVYENHRGRSDLHLYLV